MDKEILEKRIVDSVSGLNKQQIREVRLLLQDVVNEVKDDCRSIAQQAVNQIINMK
ncbi:hypothetical protein [Pseudoalteromonas galatheae]|uniref:hypothetical protein n=1 Tax=Pseudoalteromonas galatheae TaxID=579562 RepID=UPI0030CBADC6